MDFLHIAFLLFAGIAGGTISTLAGGGHEYLAFDDWESDVTFDNLRIRPAP